MKPLRNKYFFFLLFIYLYNAFDKKKKRYKFIILWKNVTKKLRKLNLYKMNFLESCLENENIFKIYMYVESLEGWIGEGRYF